jgi:hypothetical protein
MLTGADHEQTGVAWLAGARFDLVYQEIMKGNFFTSSLNQSEIVDAAAKSGGNHGEL